MHTDLVGRWFHRLLSRPLPHREAAPSAVLLSVPPGRVVSGDLRYELQGGTDPLEFPALFIRETSVIQDLFRVARDCEWRLRGDL